MTRQARTARRTRDRERGKKRLLVCLVVVALVIVSALVIKGCTAGNSPDDKDSQEVKPHERNPKITIVWDQITSSKSNAKTIGMEVPKGLEVISPTWFSFDTDALNGNLIDLASKDYVDWAHENGLEVWALFSDNFNQDVSRQVLSDEKKREHVINQVMGFADTYALDGINVDFEMVGRDQVEDFLQFLRELSEAMKAKDLVLSVDVYVPASYNLYYNRTEIGNIADYVIIMGYDEHYAGSETEGPIASIGYVDKGIADTLSEVPAEKVILGLPFYTRVWKIKGEAPNTELSSVAYGMVSSYELFIENDAEFVWDDEKKCYYAEYTGEEDGIPFVNRVWLEDERSIEEKLKLVESYNLAGTSGWRLGLEKPGIWELIDDYANNG